MDMSSMYVCVYICIHRYIHTYTHIHTCIHTYLHTYIETSIQCLSPIFNFCRVQMYQRMHLLPCLGVRALLFVLDCCMRTVCDPLTFCAQHHVYGLQAVHNIMCAVYKLFLIHAKPHVYGLHCVHNIMWAVYKLFTIYIRLYSYMHTYIYIYTCRSASSHVV